MKRTLALVTVMALFMSAFALVLLAFTDGPVVAAGEGATGELKDKDGKSLGKADFVQNADGSVKLTVKYNNIPAGLHGMHVHAVGKCEGPDFATAGAHFNPTNKQHGNLNPAGPHPGDIAVNLEAPAGGSGTLEVTSKLFTLSDGATSVFDADGAALVIHAAADDFKTDPTGNSGGRIACAVLSKVTLPAQGGAPAAGQGGGQSSDMLFWVVLGMGGILVISATSLTLVRRRAGR